MVATRKIIVALFEGLEEDTLSVSIGVPNLARTEMKIVELITSSPVRQEGNRYPVRRDPNLRHTMPQSLMDGKPTITPDARQEAELAGKSYRSILCFPIQDSQNHTIAVLNIDGPEIGMFGDESHLRVATSLATIAYSLSRANLKALAIVINEADLYKDYRQS